MSQSFERPIVARPPSSSWLGAVVGQADDLAAEPELLDRDGLGLDRLAVDHRVAPGSGLRLRLAGLRHGALHHPRGDPELAHLQVVVGLELHLGRREQLVALAARVLGDVLLQLALQRLLVARELLAVGRRQVDRVLVRRVHARDRDHAVVLHLLDELARQLDRLHVGAKSAPEDPLEEAFQLVLDVPEDAHPRGVMPRAGTLTPGPEGQDGAGGPGRQHERNGSHGRGRQERGRRSGLRRGRRSTRGPARARTGSRPRQRRGRPPRAGAPGGTAATRTSASATADRVAAARRSRGPSAARRR